MIEELQKVFEILNLSYDENKDRQPANKKSRLI